LDHLVNVDSLSSLALSSLDSTAAADAGVAGSDKDEADVKLHPSQLTGIAERNYCISLGPCQTRNKVVEQLYHATLLLNKVA